jgi:hypothetical protein
VATARAVPFIDLNDIMGPMWDAAEDFCHPRGHVAAAEAVKVLNHILGAALVNGSSAAPPFVNTISVGEIIRFLNFRSLYLRNGTELREFPDGGTFMKMGFEFGTESVLEEWKKIFFTFGPALPSL